GEDALEDAAHQRIGRRAVGRNDDTAVDQIAVDVGTAEALAAAFGVGRLGHLDQFERPALRVARQRKRPVVLAHDAIVLAARLAGFLDQHDAGTGEDGDAVDMAIGLDLDRVARQPHHVAAAEHALQLFGNRLAAPAGIAVLVGKAGPGGEDRALAIDADAAALGDEIGYEARQALAFENGGGKRRVAVVGPVLAAP